MLWRRFSPGRQRPKPEGRGGGADSGSGLRGSEIPLGHVARRGDRSGRFIRHAPLRAAVAVFPLTVAMIEPTLRAVLMTAVGLAPLFAKGWDPTLRTAITLTAITVATDPENRVTATACSLSKNSLALIRHPGCQVGLDKDDSSWQGKTIRC